MEKKNKRKRINTSIYAHNKSHYFHHLFFYLFRVCFMHSNASSTTPFAGKNIFIFAIIIYCYSEIVPCNMLSGRLSVMDHETALGIQSKSSGARIHHELWPLDNIDPKNAKFPCCVVWTPLPVVSWLAPFIGHVGICREDGAIVDFSGSNFVKVGDFAFGAAARYLQLDREQCCFPPSLAEHTCKQRHKHSGYRPAITWDDALQTSMRHFEHKSYNLFTCNCHSFVANCLNRLCYGGSMEWNMVNVAAIVLFKGRWVDSLSVLKSFFPFIMVLCLGVLMVGWPFLIGLLSFSLLLIGWFLLGTYCFKQLQEC